MTFFVCFVARAICLEHIMEAFIAALEWFVAQCLKLHEILSYCDKDFFHCDAREVRDFMKFLTTETTQDVSLRYVCDQVMK